MVNPQVVITLAVAGAAAAFAMAGGLLVWLRTPGLDQTQPSPFSQPRASSATAMRCSPSFSCRPPTSPPLSFSILLLDPLKPPFDPADDCAYPYSPNYKAAERAVTDAWAKMSDGHDGDVREWRDIFSMAAFTLLNDTSRIL
ncbi:hypothetical protein FALCPG4_018411 [Fusarium falciforme]